jgi:hypothetical protein
MNKNDGTFDQLLNNKTAHTTGLYFTNFSKLYYTRLKLVFSTQHSIIGLELALLPILSYDYNNITSNNI